MNTVGGSPSPELRAALDTTGDGIELWLHYRSGAVDPEWLHRAPDVGCDSVEHGLDAETLLELAQSHPRKEIAANAVTNNLERLIPRYPSVHQHLKSSPH
jgi:hypothetical protein